MIDPLWFVAIVPAFLLASAVFAARTIANAADESCDPARLRYDRDGYICEPFTPSPASLNARGASHVRPSHVRRHRADRPGRGAHPAE